MGIGLCFVRGGGRMLLLSSGIVSVCGINIYFIYFVIYSVLVLIFGPGSKVQTP